MGLEEEHQRSKEYWNKVTSARAQAPAQFRYQYDFYERYKERLEEPILDVGCGDGELLESLAVDGRRELYGIDISEVAIRLARSRLRPYLGDGAEEKIQVGDMLDLSRHFARGFFRTVFCEGTFHQTTYHGAKLTAREISYVTSEGGLVYLSVRSDSTPPRNACLVDGEMETYRLEDEDGVVRCYFSEQGVLALFTEAFDVLELGERELITKVGRAPYRMRIMMLRRKS